MSTFNVAAVSTLTTLDFGRPVEDFDPEATSTLLISDSNSLVMLGHRHTELLLVVNSGLIYQVRAGLTIKVDMVDMSRVDNTDYPPNFDCDTLVSEHSLRITDPSDSSYFDLKLLSSHEYSLESQASIIRNFVGKVFIYGNTNRLVWQNYVFNCRVNTESDRDALKVFLEKIRARTVYADTALFAEQLKIMLTNSVFELKRLQAASGDSMFEVRLEASESRNPV